MDKTQLVYVVAESCPFDAVLVRDMKKSVNRLTQLNLKRFRVPQKSMTKYSALDVMKQALELMFEFSPSRKNYREALRTIQVYSEGDDEMLQTIRSSFRFIVNAVYNAYAAQRQVEMLAPDVLFLQGIQVDSMELQQAFRFVGVRPPEIPTLVKRTVFLDAEFEPYRLVLGERISEGKLKGREEHWLRTIKGTISDQDVKALLCVGTRHVAEPSMLDYLTLKRTGSLTRLLGKHGMEVKVVERVADVNDVFGR